MRLVDILVLPPREQNETDALERLDLLLGLGAVASEETRRQGHLVEIFGEDVVIFVVVDD